MLLPVNITEQYNEMKLMYLHKPFLFPITIVPSITQVGTA